jgi:uncharacterized protein
MNSGVPIIDADNEKYWRYLQQGEPQMQRCSACGYWRYPPRWLCPECLSEDSAWQVLSGHGTIYSFIWYMESLHPTFVDVPYNVVIVRLDEGPLVISNVVNVSFGDIAVGQRVDFRIDEGPGGFALLRFALGDGERTPETQVPH